jgi:1,4-alpha-glucan branching enzyme
MLWLTLVSTAGSFDRNCVPCHSQEGVPLRKTFMNALLIYSGEHNMKAGLKYFLRHPSRETSVMGEEYFKSHRLMPPSTLSDSELEEALNEYWERYKVIGRLH